MLFTTESHFENFCRSIEFKQNESLYRPAHEHGKFQGKHYLVLRLLLFEAQQ